MTDRPPESVPAVSVVIPAYNRAATIGAAIESVLRQTWGDFELIVVDDGSQDTTMAVVAGIADARLRSMANPRNLGAGGARNTGLRAARAPWVAFQDSDDEWLPRKLEKQMARLTAPGAGFVAAYCGMLILGDPAQTDEEGGRRRLAARYFPGPEQRLVEGDILPALMRANLVSTQTLIARREDLLAVGGFDERFQALEDWECALRLAQRGRFAFVDEPLVVQRFSPNSLTRDAERQNLARVAILEKHLDLFRGDPAALARFHYHIAGGFRRLGHPAEARQALGAAIRTRPLTPRYWLMAGYLRLLDLLPGAAR